MGIYPFEDYQHYSPNIHTPNDLIGPSVNSFEMSQQYCRMNIGCLAELANVVDHTDVPEINDMNDEIVRYEVYDLMGRMVYTKQSVWTNVDEIRVNNLPSGVYMIRLFVQNGNVITKKIIIK